MASNDKPVLQLHEVSYSCQTHVRGHETHVLANVSLSVKAGEFVAIVGPTGCGKSTLLNLCAGLLAPTYGHITLFDGALSGLDPRIGYMFQDEVLMPWLTVLENVVLGLNYRGIVGSVANQQGCDWLARTGLSQVANAYPAQLSGGMRKRVSLAQTLICDPQIILMDEPFSALDIQTRQLMEQELLALWEKSGSAVLFVTHDLDEAITLADRVIVLSTGPESHPIREFPVRLKRPRQMAQIRTLPAYNRLYQQIWEVLGSEVLNSYKQRTGTQ